MATHILENVFDPDKRKALMEETVEETRYFKVGSNHYTRGQDAPMVEVSEPSAADSKYNDVCKMTFGPEKDRNKGLMYFIFQKGYLREVEVEGEEPGVLEKAVIEEVMSDACSAWRCLLEDKLVAKAMIELLRQLHGLE